MSDGKDILKKGFFLKILLMFLSFGCFSASVAQTKVEEERILFLDKLQLEEEQEQKELHQKIESMSEIEFRAFLNQRLLKNLQDKDIVTVIVIVDVMDLPKKDIMPSASFKSTENLSNEDGFSVGIKKIIKIIDNIKIAQAQLSQSQKKRIPYEPKIYSLNSLLNFKNSNGTKEFEKVEVSLNRQALMALSYEREIIDIQLENSKNDRNNIVAVHTETGRMYPQPISKVYSPQFLKDGYYQELKESFKEKNRVDVSILLVGSEKSNKNDKDKAELTILLNDVLGSLPKDQYTVVRQKTFSAIINCTESVADQLYKDTRVRSLADYQLQVSQYNVNSY